MTEKSQRWERRRNRRDMWSVLGWLALIVFMTALFILIATLGGGINV